MGCVVRFDGDGMVHAVRLKNGKVSYSNRWVETSRLQQERDAGKPLFGKVSTPALPHQASAKSTKSDF